MAVAVAILAAIVGPLVAYFVAARRFSGKIESSEATDLWKESSAIRADYRARVEILEQENRELREARAVDRERIAVLEQRIRQLEGDDAPNWLS